MYVFNDWSNKVYQRKPRTISEFKKIATQEWNRLPITEVGKKYSHMVTIFPWVVRNNDDGYQL